MGLPVDVAQDLGYGSPGRIEILGRVVGYLSEVRTAPGDESDIVISAIRPSFKNDPITIGGPPRLRHWVACIPALGANIEIDPALVPETSGDQDGDRSDITLE